MVRSLSRRAEAFPFDWRGSFRYKDTTMLKVRQALKESIPSAPPQTTVRAAVDVMRREQTDALLIGEQGTFTGIVTEVDIVHDVIASGLDPAATPIERVMSRPLREVEADCSIAEASEIMARERMRHLAVRDGGRIVGLFSVRDFLETNSLPLAPARQVMSSPVHSVVLGTTARAAAIELKQQRHGSLLVTRSGVPVGIVTESDLVHKIVGRDLSPAETAVEQIMSAPLVSVDVNLPVESVRELMAKRRIRHLGVTEQGRIVGVISARDLLHPTFYEVIGW
jgi:signal-transduction protein with cAMP-binding, CBS, and nucleotidyltransferase domain